MLSRVDNERYLMACQSLPICSLLLSVSFPVAWVVQTMEIRQNLHQTLKENKVQEYFSD